MSTALDTENERRSRPVISHRPAWTGRRNLLAHSLRQHYLFDMTPHLFATCQYAVQSSLRPLRTAFAAMLPVAVSPVVAETSEMVDALDVGIKSQLNSWVSSQALLPDGRIIIAGGFDSVQGVPRRNIARLNADGSLDQSFHPTPDGYVYSVAVQADGKLLFGGHFATLRPNGAAATVARGGIARMHVDGSLDEGFDPHTSRGDDSSGVYSIAVQRDGKILLGGAFTALQPNGAAKPVARQFLARLNVDGSLDAAFDPRPGSFVKCLAVQANGKILLGGLFTTIQPNGAASPTERQYVARLNADGTLDTGFDPKPDNKNPEPSVGVTTLALQPDGKILLGGGFATLQPNAAANATRRNHIARVNADGSLDAGFDPSTDRGVNCLTLQADGKVLVGGGFNTLQPNGAATASRRNHVARLNADGSLDTAFNPNADNGVACLAVQADGKILVGGHFTTLNPGGAEVAVKRSSFARLNNTPPPGR